MMQDASNDDLPYLTEIVSEPMPGDLPILTQIVIGQQDEDALADQTPPAMAMPTTDEFQPVVQEFIAASAPRSMGAEDMQLLLQHIETHLETVFTSKLNDQLEQLQKLAVDLAVSEFKAELPQLLHDALNTSPHNH